MDMIKILDQISLLYKRKDSIQLIDNLEGKSGKVIGDNKTVWMVHQNPGVQTYPKDWKKSVEIFDKVSWIGSVDDFNNLNGQVDGMVLYVFYMGGSRFDQSIDDKKLSNVKNKLNNGEIIMVPVIVGEEKRAPNIVPSKYDGDDVFDIYLNNTEKNFFVNDGKYKELGNKIRNIGQPTKINIPKPEKMTPQTLWLVIQDSGVTTYPDDWKSVDIFKKIDWVGNVDDFSDLPDPINGKILYLVFCSTVRIGSVCLKNEKFNRVKAKLNQGEIAIVGARRGNRETAQPIAKSVEVSGKNYKGFTIWFLNKTVTEYEEELVDWMKKN